MTKCNIILCYR